MSELIVREGESQINETTHVVHRPSGIDEMVVIGPVTFWVLDAESRERFQHKLIRQWVQAGWGDEIAEMLAQELAKLPDAPEPFRVVPGGVS